ncbi:MAG: hypothetical protein K6T85_10295 [Gorillibacterium sp.]|nr:hypothetical protein [Gorillibacterium sp.]
MYTLENEHLIVHLYEWPGVRQYEHKSSGQMMLGSSAEGKLAVNGRVTDWEEWEIQPLDMVDLLMVSYSMHLKRLDLKLRVDYRLQDNKLAITWNIVEDVYSRLNRLDWIDQPLLACDQKEFAFSRSEIKQKSWEFLPSGGRGIYDRTQIKAKIQDSIPDRSAVPTMHTCIFNDDLCCFVYSNYPVIPLLSEVSEKGSFANRADLYTISLNTYQYRVRNRIMEPLEIEVVFLTDLNGDSKADECDYQLWLNRQFPDANPIYREAIWYKVFCAEKKRGVLTTFQETLEIIRQIHNITNGIPQIVYLVGWQFEGHDTGYPSLNRLNTKLAVNPDRVLEELLELIRRAKEEYDCTISYHINVDDAFPNSPDWNPDILSRDPDGSPRVWIDPDLSDPASDGISRTYHISHTKDVESGEVFRRLDEFLALVPVEGTVHLDAFRNTNASWDGDAYIGPIEELICGMRPIIAYLNAQGIDVSTEGLNGMPIEDAGVFSAYWHCNPSLLYHGKIVGGGNVDLNAVAWGKGASIDADILFRGEPTRLAGDQFQSNDFASNWNRIVDILYLGSILYQFYLRREMV